MKLGTQTGSVINHLQSRMVRGQPEPKVGMGCTILAWTDRYPATIIGHSRQGVNPTVITVIEDKAERMDSNGMSESQSYYYSPDKYGKLWIFRQGKDGVWCEAYISPETGRLRKVKGGGFGLRVGEREMYHDFSF
jgi:hypothetical protein